MEFVIRTNVKDQRTNSSGDRSYQTQLSKVESLIQHSFDFQGAQDIYVQLLNDRTLGTEAQYEINSHIVQTYKRYGEVHYERQLSTLFLMVHDDMKSMHQEINLQLASGFNDAYTCLDGEMLNDEFKSLGIPQAHLHIASVLKHVASSSSLATIFAEGKLVTRNMDQAIAYAEQAKNQGDNDAVFNLGLLCEELGKTDNDMANAALTCFELAASEFHMKAVDKITHPGITTDNRGKKEETDILSEKVITANGKPISSNEMTEHQLEELAELEQISGDKTVFGEVDDLIASGKLKEAEAALKEIIKKDFTENHANGPTAREVENLFNERPCMPTHVKDWYCDRGPIYTKVALKLAKIRKKELQQLILPSEEVVQMKSKKVTELIGVVNSVGNARQNKDIKLELGEWYLTIDPSIFDFITDDEQNAINLLEEINLKTIPAAYPKMKELAKELARRS